MLYPQENEARALISLDGSWRFILDQDGKGFERGWTAGLPAEAELIAVPASFNDQKDDAAYRTHCGWVFYEKTVTIPRLFAGQRMVLRFDAAAHLAKVYVNGVFLTEHKGGFLPFEAELSDVQAGETLRIVVAVNNEINHGTLPIGNEGAVAFFGSDNPGIPSVEAAKRHRKKQNIPNFDFFNYAGLNRSVRIYTTPKQYIDDVTILTEFDCADVEERTGAGAVAVTAKKAKISVRVQVQGAPKPSAKKHAALSEPVLIADKDSVDNQTEHQVSLKNSEKALSAASDAFAPAFVRILDAQGKCVAQESFDELDKDTDKDTAQCLEATLMITDAQLWEPHPGVPYLYTAEITYGSDVYAQRFGIRSVEVRGTQFLINGKPFYFKGCCKHEDSAVHGRGFDLAYNIKDVGLLKWLGANSFRTSHYPYAEEVYALCDEEGIVIIDETPAVGIGAGASVDPYKNFRMHEHHRQVVAEYIARDKNHPSVVMWSLGNEPDLEHFPDSAYAYWHALYELAHRLDPQNRPVTVVCCQNDYTKDITTRSMDVVCINRYYGWYNVSGDMDAACYGWNVELDFWEKIGKPVMCSEYGADTIEGLHMSAPEMFTEEYQLEFYRRTDAEFDKRPFFIGEHVWNFADYMTIQGPMRVNGNRKGIFTRDRRPKLAAHWLRQRWHAIPNYFYKEKR